MNPGQHCRKTVTSSGKKGTRPSERKDGETGLHELCASLSSPQSVSVCESLPPKLLPFVVKLQQGEARLSPQTGVLLCRFSEREGNLLGRFQHFSQIGARPQIRFRLQDREGGKERGREREREGGRGARKKER